ncbi:MAG TPA: hypothetical protein PLM75_02375 [bacterium]|nr:hypothetical protein [bacterium]HPP86691.1 hypothetical protein [bacterium]
MFKKIFALCSIAVLAASLTFVSCAKQEEQAAEQQPAVQEQQQQVQPAEQQPAAEQQATDTAAAQVK